MGGLGGEAPDYFALPLLFSTTVVLGLRFAVALITKRPVIAERAFAVPFPEPFAFGISPPSDHDPRIPMIGGDSLLGDRS